MTAPPATESSEVEARSLLAAARRRRLALPASGVEIALLEWGEGGPLALLHHANGFCKGSWALVARDLARDHRVVAMDARGHGDSSKPEGPLAYAWPRFADDLVAVAELLCADAAQARVALGVGHSFGGTSFLGAARRRPQLFERLVLVDPVTPPRPAQATAERQRHVGGLSDRARRRRAHWSSREEARRWLAERELFAHFDPRALDLYVLDGLDERADGSVVLKTPPEVEAAIFAGGSELDVFALAAGIAVPTLLLWATRGSFSRSVYEEIAGSMAAARVEDVDAGHLAPMEHPERVVRAIRRFAAEESAGLCSPACPTPA